jgi:hypothetical protein
MSNEILPMQVWKSKYAEIFYEIYGGSENVVEAFNAQDVWDCINIKKTDLIKHYTLIK